MQISVCVCGGIKFVEGKQITRLKLLNRKNITEKKTVTLVTVKKIILPSINNK